MNRKLFILMQIILISIIGFSLTREYVKEYDHDFQVNEEELSPEEYKKFQENKYEEGKIISFSGEMLQIIREDNLIGFKLITEWNERNSDFTPDTYGGGGFVIVFLDRYTQEQLLEHELYKRVIYFKNIKYIGTIEDMTITGFKRTRPIFTFTNESRFFITYEYVKEF